MKNPENATQIAELKGIWSAVAQTTEDPSIEIDGFDFSEMDSESARFNESLRDVPITPVEEKIEEAVAINLAINEAKAENEPPSMAPEAWEAREEVVRALVALDEREVAMELLQSVDQGHADILLLAIADEMIKVDDSSTIPMLMARGFVERVGHSRRAELWTALYIKMHQNLYLDLALLDCAASVSEFVPYGAVHPYMKVWQKTGATKALEAATAIAANHPIIEVRVKAHQIIASFTGDVGEYILAFTKARMITDQGTRVGLVRSLITGIMSRAIHLSISSDESAAPGEKQITRENLERLLREMPHKHWADALRRKLKGIGVTI